MVTAYTIAVVVSNFAFIITYRKTRTNPFEQVLLNLFWVINLTASSKLVWIGPFAGFVRRNSFKQVVVKQSMVNYACKINSFNAGSVTKEKHNFMFIGRILHSRASLLLCEREQLESSFALQWALRYRVFWHVIQICFQRIIFQTGKISFSG